MDVPVTPTVATPEQLIEQLASFRLELQAYSQWTIGACRAAPFLRSQLALSLVAEIAEHLIGCRDNVLEVPDPPDPGAEWMRRLLHAGPPIRPATESPLAPCADRPTPAPRPLSALLQTVRDASRPPRRRPPQRALSAAHAAAHGIVLPPPEAP